MGGWRVMVRIRRHIHRASKCPAFFRQSSTFLNPAFVAMEKSLEEAHFRETDEEREQEENRARHKVVQSDDRISSLSVSVQTGAGRPAEEAAGCAGVVPAVSYEKSIGDRADGGGERIVGPVFVRQIAAKPRRAVGDGQRQKENCGRANVLNPFPRASRKNAPTTSNPASNRWTGMAP